MASSDFKERESKKSNFNPVGRSGTFITSDTVQNDYLEELNGQDAQETYTKMLLSNSTIRKLYHATLNPIKSAEWDIEPASDEQKDIDAAALMKEIIFNNIIGGWKAKLDEILTFPWHGHSIFEIVHRNYNSPKFGPYTGLANLAFRDQRTIDKWEFDKKTGKLGRLHQLQSGDVEVNAWMDIDTLLIFFNEKKGDDTGYPFCRMLYGNWKRVNLYKQLQAIGIERSALSVPHLKVPDSVDYKSDEYQDAVTQLAAYTQGEQAFFVTPMAYELHHNPTATFDPAKVQAAIKAENEEISGSLVAMWLEMGIGGNSAVGSSTGISAEFFRDGIEYLADKVADVINLQLIPHLCELNFGDTLENYPCLVHNGIADEAGKELMLVVTGYAKQGLITPDEQLEDHIRKVHNLPAKMEGEILDNGETEQDNNNPDDDSHSPSGPNGNGTEGDDENEEDVELSTKSRKPKTPKQLIDQEAPLISEDIRKNLTLSSEKYVKDIMNRYKQLPKNKKQNATSKIVMSGKNQLKKDLKRSLTKAAFDSIEMARKEVPAAKDVKLSNHEESMLRMIEKYGDVKDIKLNDFSSLPSYIQVLIAKQADLIAEDSLAELESRVAFSFSSIETKSSDENVIKQSIEDAANDFIDSNQINTKGTNAASTMVNEGRNAFFFEDDVLEEIHSFTFMNAAPKSDICRELAGTTFPNNDAESLRYSPPLHHNCKSYLRANLKTSKGVENLEVSTLSPSAKAKKSITL